MALKPTIAKVINREDLTFDEAQEAMNAIMSGEATPAQIAGYLVALRMKGETADEIAGSAAAMRSHYISVDVALSGNQKLIDTCGTGGDGKHTFNISTTAAFVVAGAGYKVAKHGNRSVSSKSGSADVLMAMGGNLDLTAAQVGECIRDVGIGFLYAINHHPAMKYAIAPRRELEQRTIFNALGPLTNPAGASHQVIGVYSPHLCEPMAETLNRLGSTAAFVVYGADGLDEFSVTGTNLVSHLTEGVVNTFALDPIDFGLELATIDELVGGTPEENAAITRAILSGDEMGAKRDIVLLNAAAAFALETGDIAAGLIEARRSIDTGAALDTLDAWVEKTNSF